MKAKIPKTPIQERAAVRASEDRRAKHAYAVLLDLFKRHGFSERDEYELYALHSRLEMAIRNQHITDERYAAYKKNREDSQTPTGDF